MDGNMQLAEGTRQEIALDRFGVIPPEAVSVGDLERLIADLSSQLAIKNIYVGRLQTRILDLERREEQRMQREQRPSPIPTPEEYAAAQADAEARAAEMAERDAALVAAQRDAARDPLDAEE
jgi:hypothetical protein